MVSFRVGFNQVRFGAVPEPQKPAAGQAHGAVENSVPNDSFQKGPQQQYLLGLANQLGQWTRIDPVSGIVQVHDGLVQALVRGKEISVPLILTVMTHNPKPMVLVEGLYALQEIGKAGVRLDPYYGSLSLFNSYPSPLVQIFLAGVYRQMQEPSIFGPVLKNFLSFAKAPGPFPPGQDPMEELGGTLLDKIAQRVALQLQTKSTNASGDTTQS